MKKFLKIIIIDIFDLEPNGNLGIEDKKRYQMNKSAKEMFDELGQILQFINNDVLTKGKTTQEDLL